jgi:hypothetical protein
MGSPSRESERHRRDHRLAHRVSGGSTEFESEPWSWRGGTYFSIAERTLQVSQAGSNVLARSQTLAAKSFLHQSSLFRISPISLSKGVASNQTGTKGAAARIAM